MVDVLVLGDGGLGARGGVALDRGLGLGLGSTLGLRLGLTLGLGSGLTIEFHPPAYTEVSPTPSPTPNLELLGDERVVDDADADLHLLGLTTQLGERRLDLDQRRGVRHRVAALVHPRLDRLQLVAHLVRVRVRLG